MVAGMDVIVVVDVSPKIDGSNDEIEQYLRERTKSVGNAVIAKYAHLILDFNITVTPLDQAAVIKWSVKDPSFGQRIADFTESTWKSYKSLVTNNKKSKPVLSGDRCPKCGFTYKWDGRVCNHCGYQKESKDKNNKSIDFTQEITLIRKYTDTNRTGNPTYEDYRCDDTELAKKFLLAKNVDKKQYYITVKTPQGIWGIDIDGLYKEHLLPWQMELGSADVEGQAFGTAEANSLAMAAGGVNDNFVIHVKCGSCHQDWIDGVRYQNWTVVECPHCHKRNKISSHNYEARFIR